MLQKRDMTKAEMKRELDQLRSELESTRRGAMQIAYCFGRVIEHAGSTLRVALKLPPTSDDAQVMREHARAMWELARGHRDRVSFACSEAGIDRPTYDDRSADEYLNSLPPLEVK